MKEDILNKLTAPFKLKARKGQGGQTFYYVPSEDVIERMNTVFKGEWCTEVIDIHQEEGYIIAHVRVSVKPPDIDYMLYHDGFASQYIARYTDGPRRGQIVDLGNSYKAAISKAIKVACSRFGVGLKLDPELNDSDQNMELSLPQNLPNIDSVNTKVESSQFVNNIPVPEVNEEKNTVSNTNQPEVPEFPTVNINQPIITDPAPSIQNESQSKESDTQNITESANLQSVLPDIPENVVDNNNVQQPTENKLTPVQETAIRVILEQYNITYEDLAKQALGRDNFPSLEELEYKDAVQILHYGNNIGKN